jgi:putative tryptophan/tyrosine transport system substrate-binding protein
MRRREFLAALAGTSALPLRVASAQQTEEKRRIGVLMGWSKGDPLFQSFAAALIDELARLGWTDGRSAAIDVRWTNADVSRVSILAKELTASRPDVLLCSTTPVTAALANATSTIPIVFAVVSDPVGAGFVASFAHPGRNITGFTNVDATQGGKLLDLIKQMAPGIECGGIMFNPDTAPGGGKFYVDTFESAARSIGIEPESLPVRSDAEIEAAISTLGRERGGLVIMSDAFLSIHLETAISAARRYDVPAIFPDANFSSRGGLMSYGPDLRDIFRRAAGYIDRILRGEKPSDLPVQTPSKFKMTINLKTAEALGLSAPPALLASADEVIE